MVVLTGATTGCGTGRDVNLPLQQAKIIENFCGKFKDKSPPKIMVALLLFLEAKYMSYTGL